MSDNEITIDDLARMVNDGFNAAQEQMDRRFEAMQGQMDRRFDAIQMQMDQRFDQVDKRLGKLERDVSDIKTVLADVPTRFEVRELDRRVTRLEEKAGLA